MTHTLSIAGVLLAAAAAVYAADPMPADPMLPTVWVIGDSTAHQTGKSPDKVGWGDVFAARFDPAKANVVNRARGGRSSRTFISEGLWADVLRDTKAGDVLLMQFGHNDSSPVDDADRSRGSLRGTGDQTQEIFNQVQKKQEVVHTYGWYLKQMIAEAQVKGMKVVVMSPVPRCPKDDRPAPTTEATGYQQWASEVATAAGVPYVDVHAEIWKTYGPMTGVAIKTAYFTPDDGTHTNAAGAELNASSVAAAVRGLKDSPIVAYLK